MTDVVARLRQLEAAATPGSWTIRGVSVRAVQDDIVGGEPLLVAFVGEADAEMIAAARNALPQLLDIAEAASGLLGSLDRCEGQLISDHEHALRVAVRALDSQETE